MRIALCDDNELFLDELEELLKTIPMAEEVRRFSCLEEFLDAAAGEVYDAVLLDINWNDRKTGIDVAEELCQIAPRMKIIYVTGYTDRFVQQIFLHRSNLSGYLTKPVDRGLLEANLRKVERELSRQRGEVLTLRSGGTLASLPLADIVYMESQGHQVVIHTTGASVTAYEKLTELLRRMPESFIQCHKSFAVNMRQIQRFRQTSILLKNGAEIPVSRRKYTQTRESYFAFMSHTF